MPPFARLRFTFCELKTDMGRMKLSAERMRLWQPLAAAKTEYVGKRLPPLLAFHSFCFGSYLKLNVFSLRHAGK